MNLRHTLLLPILLLSACTPTPTPQERLLAEFSEIEALERENFAKLVFTPSPVQQNKSVVMKFLLRDQLGRDWLFKASLGGNSDSIVAVQRFYDLLGLDTPEAHYVTILLNGQPLEGTVQRFVPNIGGMTDDIYWALPPAMANYLARAHLLDWLFANDQLHAKNFIVLPDPQGRPAEVMRIDNAINWHFMGHDRLDIDYVSPWMRVYAKSGYLFFWRPYLQRTFDLPLAELQRWARFISGVPDRAFEEILKKAIENDLDQMVNNGLEVKHSRWLTPEIIPIDPATFLPRLLARKKNLSRDAQKLYASVAQLRGEPLPPPAPGGDEAEYKSLSERLGRKRTQLRAEKEALAAAGGTGSAQPSIEMRTSVEGYKALRKIKGLVSVPRTQRFQFLQEARAQLEKLNNSPAPRLEKEALSNALKNFKKIEGLIKNDHNKDAIVDAPTAKLLYDINFFFNPEWPELDSLVASRKQR